MIRPDIEDLVGRYCEAVLRVDLALFASTWCEDATWSIPGAGAVVGRTAITETFATIRSTYRRCVQEVLNGVVTPSGPDDAAASWQVRELQWRADGTGSELIGVYHDDLRRGVDGWQFARRDFELLYDGPLELPGRLREGRGPRPDTGWGDHR